MFPIPVPVSPDSSKKKDPKKRACKKNLGEKMHIKLISEYENPTENNSPGLTEPQLVSELDYETQDQTFLVNTHHTF